MCALKAAGKGGGGAGPAGPGGLPLVEEAREVDTGALSKYGIAIGVQMAAIAAFLSAVDAGLSAVGLEAQAIPQPAVVLFFIGLALKSRVFSPLNNQRPDLEKAVKGEESKGFNDRTMPSWTPPGVPLGGLRGGSGRPPGGVFGALGGILGALGSQKSFWTQQGAATGTAIATSALGSLDLPPRD